MTNEEAKEILEKMGATKQEHWEAVKVAIRVLDEAGKTEPKQPTYGIKGSCADVEFELINSFGGLAIKMVGNESGNICKLLANGTLMILPGVSNVPGLQLDGEGRIKVSG